MKASHSKMRDGFISVAIGITLVIGLLNLPAQPVEASVISDCAIDCLIGKLRSPRYFAIHEEEVPKDVLQAYVAAHKEAIIAILLQVDYGSELVRYLDKRVPLLPSEGELFSRLDRLSKLIDLLKRIAETLGDTLPGQAAGTLSQVVRGGQVFLALRAVYTWNETVNLLQTYFTYRFGEAPRIGCGPRVGSAAEAWARTISEPDVSELLQRVSAKIGRQAVNEWAENALVTYRLVACDPGISPDIRREMGKAIARLALASWPTAVRTEIGVTANLVVYRFTETGQILGVLTADAVIRDG